MQLRTLAFAAGLAALPAPAARAQVPLNKPGPGFRLKTPAGKPLALADLRGKVVLLDFWGPS